MTLPVHRILEALHRRRFLMLGLLGLVVSAALFHLPKLSVDNSLRIWFPRNDPILEDYRRFVEDFGSDETVMLLLTDPDGFPGKENRELLRQVTLRLAAAPLVERVVSLSNWPRMDLLLSRDRRSTALLIQPETLENMDQERERVLAGIRDVVESSLKSRPIEYRLAGIGVIYEALNRVSLQDSRVIFVISYALVLTMLLVFVRDLRLATFSMIVIGTSVAVTMGLFAFCGRALNMITMVIPSLITIYGISDVVHLVHAYQRRYQNTPAARRPRVLVSAAAEVAVPCFLTSLTTAIGFSSLAFSRIMIIRDLGVFTAAGIVITYFCSFVLALGLPGLFPAKIPRRRLTDFTAGIRGLVSRRPTLVLIAAASLLAVAVPGALRVQVDTFSIGLLKRQHPVRAASDYIEQHFGSYAPVHLLLEGDAQILDPRWMRAASDLRRELEAHPQTARWIGPDILPCLSTADSTSELHDCLDSMDPGVAASFVNPRRDALRLSGAAKMMSAAGFKALLGDLESFANASLAGTPLRVRASGYLTVYVRMMDYIAETQIGSSLIALAVVLVLAGLIAGNPARALCAAAANIFPVVLVIGFMGWSGIPLDVATVTIAAISIGIVVDDTLHILYRLRTRSALGESARAGMDRTVREIGRPVVATSLILTAGYAVMLLAQVRSIIFFGLLSSIVVAAALAGDLLLLPALVHQFAASGDGDG